MSITATLVREDPPDSAHRGHWKIYRLSEPVPYWDTTTEYVIASAVVVEFDGGRPEVYLFPANADGEIVSWGEMDGSLKDTLDHEAAVAAAGWVLA